MQKKTGLRAIAMSHCVAAAGAAACVLAFAGAASAAVLASVAPYSAGSLINLDTGQNFYVKFTLADDALLSGFGIYSTTIADIGDAVTIRIRADNAGEPAGTYLFNFTDVIDTEQAVNANTDFVAAHFSPIALSAGSYWIGLSGHGANMPWRFGIGGADKVGVRQASGNKVTGPIGINQRLAWSLEGEYAPISAAVPEPTTWALMIGGFGLAGAALRRRRSALQPT